MRQTILGDPSAAEDVAQDTFVRAWRHASTYDARRGAVASWLLTIARNLALDRARLTRSRPVDPDLIASQLEWPASPAGTDDAAQVAERDRLRELLLELPPEQRRALVLATYFGRTAKEISELDGTPVGTVKTRIRDGLLKLRTRMRWKMGPSSPDCARTREALPELALGIATGEQRALVLDHVAACADCRRELEELSSVADELIALAPQREPPPGFENRVLDRVAVRHPGRRPARRRLRRLALAAAMPAIAAATALAISVSYSSDRSLASQYRAALQGAHGKYFQSAHLNTPAGQEAGIAFAYQGSPSWLFYTLGGRYTSGLYKEQIITRSGSTLTLPPFRLINGSWGIATPVPVRDIARIKLSPQPRAPTLEAILPVVER